jgi:GGDEF domain-containing protein
MDGVPVGASFGLAVLGPDGSDYATLLARADAAMYAAKRAGRAVATAA